jgi:hypothetical protein
MMRTLLPAILLGFAICGPAGAEEQELTDTARNSIDHGEVRSTLEIHPTSVPSGSGASLQASFVVENAGASPILLTFPSSQSYDFQIRDSQARVVWKWSADRVFAMMIVEKTLHQEPLRFEEEIPLVDDNERPLPAGEYSLEVRLTADLPVENSVSFQIR